MRTLFNRDFSALLAISVFAPACGENDPTPTNTDTTADTSVGVDTAEPPLPECPEPTGARPGARAEHAGIYDPAKDTLVTFGGSFGVPQNCSSIVNHTYESDTWIYDVRCGQWRSAAGPGPAGRVRHGAVLDTRNRRMLIYGGRSRVGSSGPYTLHADVDAFDLDTETWSTVPTSNTPPARFNAATAYDDINHRLLVFGGNTSASGLVYEENNEVWALDLTSNAWSKLTVAPSGAPKPRFWVNGAYDSARQWFVVYGGTNGTEAFSNTAKYYDDLWALDLSLSPPTWFQLNTTAPTPPGRFWAGIVVDPPRNRYLMFGGHDDQNLGNRNDIWEFSMTTQTWKTLRVGDAYNRPPAGFCDFPPDFATIDDGSPERRHAHVFAGGPDLAITSGGKTDCGNVDDVYAFDYTTDTWTELLPSTIGEACLRKGGVACNDMCF